MPGQRIGSLIAAVFGLIYVLVNAGPLPPAWTLTLRVLAAVAFGAVLVTVLVAVLGSSVSAREPRGHDRRVFGRGYWLVVAAEFIALFVGVRVLSGPLDAPEAGVAWVSLVVGVHFFALAVVFSQRFFHGLGAAITACGVIGLVLAATGAGEPTIALVAGVLPGAVLLGFAWWGVRWAQPTTKQQESVTS